TPANIGNAVVRPVVSASPRFNAAKPSATVPLTPPNAPINHKPTRRLLMKGTRSEICTRAGRVGRTRMRRPTSLPEGESQILFQCSRNPRFRRARYAMGGKEPFWATCRTSIEIDGDHFVYPSWPFQVQAQRNQECRK